MSNFWINEQGQNTLKGSETNPLNPIIIPNENILEFLKQYPKARTDLFALLPSLDLDEQARLESLIEQHKTILTDEVYPQVEEDRFQSKMNSTRINSYTSGSLRNRKLPSKNEARSGLRLNTHKFY